jgi:hypothetical protein
MTDRIDDAIDRAVREMLDVEPRADLRARVVDRIEGRVASAFRRKVGVASTFPGLSSVEGRWKSWVFVPLAAAAVLALAVWAPWGQAPIVMVPATPPSVAKAEPPSDVFLPQPPLEAPRTKHVPPQFAEAPRGDKTQAPGRADRNPAAVVAAELPPAEDFPRVPALSVPELVVPAIRTLVAVEAPAQLSVAPIPVLAPIEIEPLSTSPRERQFQE